MTAGFDFGKLMSNCITAEQWQVSFKLPTMSFQEKRQKIKAKSSNAQLLEQSSTREVLEGMKIKIFPSAVSGKLKKAEMRATTKDAWEW